MKIKLFFFLPLAIYLMACSNIINKKNKKNTEGCLIFNEEAIQNASYTEYSGNVARLRAMMCGKYTQYLARVDSNGNISEEKQLWTINNGEDSIITYIVPVGDYRKVGYWVYYAQCLTTLPNEPVYSTFYHLEELSRDTLQLTHYKLPKDKNINIANIIANPHSILNDIELKALQPKGFETILIRKSLFHFEGKNQQLESVQDNILQMLDVEWKDEIQYKTYFFDIKPQQIVFGNIFFDAEENLLGKGDRVSFLAKRGIVKKNYLLGNPKLGNEVQ